MDDALNCDSFKLNDSIRTFVYKLLRKDPMERLTMLEALTDPFFMGSNVLNWHKNLAPPLNVGMFTPQIDAKWNRRQFSSIWAPQPRDYSVTLSSSSRYRHSSDENEAIIELDESESKFS